MYSLLLLPWVFFGVLAWRWQKGCPAEAEVEDLEEDKENKND